MSAAAEKFMVPTSRSGPIELETIITPLPSEKNGKMRGWLLQSMDVTKVTMLTEDLRALSQKLISTQEIERSHLAHELHDGLGMMLAALRMDISWMKRKTRSAAMTMKLDELSSNTLKAASELSRICKGLRPLAIDSFGLSHAVAELLKDFESWAQERYSIVAQIEDIASGSIPKDTSMSIFRILQEALTNITKHSDANKIEVNLFTRKRDIILRIRDNGKGIDRKKMKRTGLGILGMKERAAGCGGTVKISSPQGGGTAIEAVIPIDTEQGA